MPTHILLWVIYMSNLEMLSRADLELSVQNQLVSSITYYMAPSDVSYFPHWNQHFKDNDLTYLTGNSCVTRVSFLKWNVYKKIFLIWNFRVINKNIELSKLWITQLFKNENNSHLCFKFRLPKTVVKPTAHKFQKMVMSDICL